MPMLDDHFSLEASANRLTQLLAAKRASGARILDLTESNPTQADLRYDEDAIVAALSDRRALIYEPCSRGLLAAREAIALYYGRRNCHVDAADLQLTASTSESYAYLLKLLCDPGDRILVPQPSYPLFDVLAGLERVEVDRYPLVYSETAGWQIDVHELAGAVNPRTRALVIVSPNNPTGSLVSAGELSALYGLCTSHKLALIADEVFVDYVATSASLAGALGLAGTSQGGAAPVALQFVLSGLSKVVGLPQCKLGWIHVAGPPALRQRALAGLDWIADAYLSVGASVQHALPRLLGLQPAIWAQITVRLEANERTLARAIQRAPACRLLRRDGGWYAVVEIPRQPTDEEWALRLLQEDDVLVQPGYFFDFPGDGHLVLSLLTPPGVFAEGVERLAARLAQA